MPRRRSKFSIQNFSYKTLFIIVFFLLIAIVALLKLTTDKKVSAAWWNDGWMYRKAVSIANSSGSNLTDFQVAINIGTSALINTSKMKTDCSDIRIIDQDGNQLPFWIEENNPGCNQISDTKIWVKTTSLPTSGATLYLYYGNPSASSVQNGNEVFLEFDDFNDSSNINNWTLESNPNTSYSISGGTMAAINTSSDYSSAVIGTDHTDIIVNSRLQFNVNQTHGGFVFRGQTNAAENSYQWVIRRADNDNRIQKRQNGVQSYLLGGTGGIVLSTTLAANTWYPAELRLNGSTIDTYFNNQQAVNGNMTDTSYSSGKIGILSYDGKEFYDYIFVRKYASSDPIPNLEIEEVGGGPIAYWKFDEGSGTTAYDSTNSQNNGTITGATWQTEDQCVSGKCLNFNGINNDIVLNQDISINSNNWTISWWMKKSNSEYEAIFTKLKNATSGQIQINSNNIKVESNTNNLWTKNFNTGINTADNKWHHYTLSFSDQNSSLHVDGKLTSTQTTNPDPAQYIIRYIGTQQSQTPYLYGDYLQGFLDDIKIYNYARTTDQIKSDYAAGKAHASSNNSSSVNLGGNKNSGEYLSDGLVGYWKMDEGVGTSTLDSSGNSNTGTLSNVTWESGKFGIGTTYNGDNSQIIIGTSSTFDFSTNDFSIAAWINQTSIENNKKIIFKGNPFCDSCVGGYTLFTQAGVPRFVIDLSTSTGDSFSAYDNSILVNDGKWHFVLGQRSGNSIQLFVDGKLIKTTNLPQNAAIVNDSGTLLTISGSGYAYNGLIDEVRIYNRALSPSEIQDLYNWSPDGNSPKKPIVYYKFDEGYGNNINNFISNSFNGTKYNTTNWNNSGKYEKSLWFDGTTAQLITNNSSSWRINGNDMSFSIWIKPDPSDDSSYIFSKPWNGSGNYNYYLTSTGGTNPSFNFKLGGATTFTLASNKSISSNQWHQISITINNANKLVKFYIDGQLTNSASHTISDWTPAGGDGNANFVIGCIYPYSNNFCAGGSTYDFKGYIDEFKLYDFALTDEEVKLDYNQGSSLSFGSNNQNIGGTTSSLDYCIPGDTSPCSPPIAEWKFEEGIGTTAYDNSGNNNSAVFGTGSFAPTWTQGKIGKSLTFDGVDDRLSIGTTISLGNTDWTVSAWMKTTNTGSAALISNSSGGPVTNNLLIMNSKITYAHYDGTWKYESGTSDISDDKWHYLIWSNHSNQTIDLYVDGKKEVTAAPSTVTNNGPVNQIGRNWGTSSNASIDHIRIYDYARTPAQIAYDYNKGAPVGHWKFDECQGNIAYDWSGIGNTGSINIGPNGTQNSLGTCQVGTSAAWTNGASGKYNSSLSFDGTDDHININSNSTLKVQSNTFSLWINAIDLDAYRGLLEIVSSSTGTRYSRLMSFGSNEIRYHISYSDFTNSYVSFPNVPLNTWVHLVGTWDGTTIKSYINGSKVGETNFTSAIPYDGDVLLKIGLDPGRYFNGKIDDVRIYNYALTPTQIKTLFNNGSISFN